MPPVRHPWAPPGASGWLKAAPLNLASPATLPPTIEAAPSEAPEPVVVARTHPTDWVTVYSLLLLGLRWGLSDEAIADPTGVPVEDVRWLRSTGRHRLGGP